MDSRILSKNAEAGITQLWHEHDDGSVTIETKQDLTDVTEDNKRTFNQIDERAGWAGDMHRVASIPMSIYYELQRKGIINDPTAMKKWLNDPDNRVFRTRPGTV